MIFKTAIRAIARGGPSTVWIPHESFNRKHCCMIFSGTNKQKRNTNTRRMRIEEGLNKEDEDDKYKGDEDNKYKDDEDNKYKEDEDDIYKEYEEGK